MRRPSAVQVCEGRMGGLVESCPSSIVSDRVVPRPISYACDSVVSKPALDVGDKVVLRPTSNVGDWAV